MAKRARTRTEASFVPPIVQRSQVREQVIKPVIVRGFTQAVYQHMSHIREVMRGTTHDSEWYSNPSPEEISDTTDVRA